MGKKKSSKWMLKKFKFDINNFWIEKRFKERKFVKKKIGKIERKRTLNYF